MKAMLHRPRPHSTEPRTLPQALAAAAEADAPVVFHGARGKVVEATTWRALHEDAVALARRLAGGGLSPGDRVGLMAETDGDFVRLFLACQSAGLVAVPLPVPSAFADKAAHAARLARMLEAAGARAAFASPALLPMLPSADGRLEMVGTLSQVANLPQSKGRLPQVEPGSLCFLQFSSGSTRFPKGVMVRHEAVIANAGAIQSGLGITPADVVVSWLPLYHDMGLVGCLLAPLIAKVPLHLLPTPEFVRNPMVWPRLMAELRGSVTYSPAFGYDLAARRAGAEGAAGLDLSRWRVAGLGGDLIRPEVLERFARAFAPAGFRDRAFVASYGLAEATLAVSMQRSGDGAMVDLVDLDRLEADGVAGPPMRAPGFAPPRTRSLVRCGRPLAGMAVMVRGPDGAPLPDRRVGHIHVAGPSLMDGYFNEPDETERALGADGWLNTGDLGYMTEGELVVTGRAKDVIIVNGRNLWPQDLEWLAEQVPPLRTGDVAAVAGEGEDGAELPVLLVQCRLIDPSARLALSTSVAQAVSSEVGVLCRVVLVPPHALPRTSSGKLSRSHARRLLTDGRFG